MRAILLALCLLQAGAALAQQPAPPVVSPPPLPPALVGHWVVTRSSGEDPLYLETNVRGLVGKPVEIGPDTIKAWDVFSGTIAHVRRSSGTLQDYLASVEHPVPGQVADAGRQFDFYLLTTRDCATHGKTLDACPAVFTLAQDKATGDVALVTLPAGLAMLGRADAAAPRTPSR